MIVESGANVRAEKKKWVAREKERNAMLVVFHPSAIPHPSFVFFLSTPLLAHKGTNIGICSNHATFSKKFAFGFINQQYVYISTWTGQQNSSVWANTSHMV